MSSSDEQRVLILAPIGRDGVLAAEVLARVSIASRVCRDVDELCSAIRSGAGCALITEETLTAPAMCALDATLAAQPAWSDFPFVVFSAGGGRRAQGAEVIRTLGNVAVIDRPVHLRTVLSAVESALRARRRQYEAREAIAQRDQFLAMLGHELRNPLGAILFAAELMGKNRDDDGVQRQRIIIDRQARHLSRLVDDLLDVSRVTSGKVVLQRQPVDLNAVVERCTQAVDVLVKANAQSLTLRLAAVPVTVDGDMVRLSQVVTNLLTNAIKYTPRGGRIAVEVLFVDGHARVHVRDSGVGIDGSMLDTIFDLFAQVPSTLDRSEGGLGLGLTLVRRLVALHGGSVSATSDGVGQGSEFVVELPARSQLVLVRPQPSPSPAVLPVRIVLVDDNHDLRESLQELLRASGHEVDTAEDGARGVAKILTIRPDVAIVDIGLPGLDGYEVARQVRGALGGGTVLIALSGYGQPDDRTRALDAGFDLHLTKPVTADTLIDAMTRRRAAGAERS